VRLELRDHLDADELRHAVADHLEDHQPRFIADARIAHALVGGRGKGLAERIDAGIQTKRRDRGIDRKPEGAGVLQFMGEVRFSHGNSRFKVQSLRFNVIAQSFKSLISKHVSRTLIPRIFTTF